MNDAGSCWAFSTVASVEAINNIVTGKFVSLSEQELVDCDREYNEGCNGGLMDYAFQFIIKNGGIDTEEDYPYKGHDGTCDPTKVTIPFFLNPCIIYSTQIIDFSNDFDSFILLQKKAKVVQIDDYEDVPAYDENALKKAVSHQPISVAIEASGRALQLYQSVSILYKMLHCDHCIDLPLRLCS